MQEKNICIIIYMTTLFDVLNNGYKDKKKKSKQLGDYVMDESLSNHNHQTYYNPKDKKLLFNVTGTHNSHDWLTNIKLGLGIGYKESDRYKQSHAALRNAKKKYGINNATLTAHSQGGLTANYISSKGDKVITLDKATTIGGKSREGSKDYRTNGDVVSLLASTRHNTINLKNPNKQTGNIGYDILKAHDIKNIKNEKLFV